MRKVTDGHVAALHAYLSDDPERAVGMVSGFEEEGSDQAYIMLIVAAFRQAVEERFVGHELGEVVRFVARWRAGSGGVDRDPLAAERLIGHALGLDTIEDLPDEAKVLQLPLLDQLVRDDGLGERELSVFLAKARHRADHYRELIRQAGSD